MEIVNFDVAGATTTITVPCVAHLYGRYTIHHLTKFLHAFRASVASIFYFYKKTNTLKKLFLIISLFTFHFSQAQTDNCGLRISLLTCTPGEELYSSFGHSALRVADSINNLDIVFNYGTFDFSDPVKFYKNFIKGKLDYFLSVDNFPDFRYEYQYFGRGIMEQVLNLDCKEKSDLLAALYENAKEENRYYKYDFNYDNCTTRLRDIIRKYNKDTLHSKNILPYTGVTFRNLIHEYLNRSGQYWSKLGIDILLGAPLDKKVTSDEAMFLPDYLMKGFDSTTHAGALLVASKQELLPYISKNRPTVFFKPLIVFSLLFLLVLIASLVKAAMSKKFLNIFDFAFFFFCGLTGALLLFMWFATDHAMCRNNLNLLWALPFHLPVVFFMRSDKSWVKNYFRFSFFLSVILLISWFFLPQQLNTALLPVTGILVLRSYFLSKAH